MDGTGSVPYRVSMVTAFFMVALTVVCDLLQILLDLTVVLSPASDLVTFLAEAALGLWFLILGIKYFEGKRKTGKILSIIVTTVVELIPIVDAIPTLTIGTIYLIYASRAEDREKFQEQQVQLQQTQEAEYQEAAQVYGAQQRYIARRAQQAAANDNEFAANDNDVDEEVIAA